MWYHRTALLFCPIWKACSSYFATTVSFFLFIILSFIALSQLNVANFGCVTPDEGVYVDTNGKITKNVVLQWGILPLTSVAYISTGQIMGWGNKAIEIRSAETGHLDGVFMHKKEQRLKFLCERNDKVSFVVACSICITTNLCF